MKTFLFVAVACLAACATSAGPIAAGALTALAALDQMLAQGTITQEQYAPLRALAMQAGSGFSPETVGTGGAILAAMVAQHFRTKKVVAAAKEDAVAKVMELRGPTEQQRRLDRPQDSPPDA